VQILEHYGAVIGAEGQSLTSIVDCFEPTATEITGITNADELIAKQINYAKNQSIGVGFLKRADKRRYGGLWTKLENSFSHGQDQYPSDLTSAYNLLLRYNQALFAFSNRRNKRRTNSTASCSYRMAQPVCFHKKGDHGC
jgi:hypothetical protein